MASLSDTKTLGGVGSILVLLTPIPYVGWTLGIAGLIMTLFAVKYISDIVKNQDIFNNMLISGALIIASTVVGTLVVLGTVFRVLGMGSFVGSSFVPAANVTVGNWLGLAAAVILGLSVVWALLIASAVFYRMSYNSVATKLNVSMFATAGLVFLIGAATTLIGIGFLLILVAQILLAINDMNPVQVQSAPSPAIAGR